MSDKVYIIAEIGINHEGDVDICAEMIRSAAESGADAVKLQTINAELNYAPDSESYNVFKGSELTQKETGDMFKLANDIGIDIFTTAGDFETVKWVENLNPSCWKISSGLLTHIPMVKYLSSLGRPLLVSTGMASKEDIDLAVKTIISEGNYNFSLLQCTSLYPAPIDSLNLSTIRWLKKRYNCKVGFSDHSLGSDAAFLSVGAGAKLIEKHFSFDIKREGFDHKISLDKKSFLEMTNRIRNAEKMMGVSQKYLSDPINKMRNKFLRSIVAIDNIYKGEIFSIENIGKSSDLLNKYGSFDLVVRDFYDNDESP